MYGHSPFCRATNTPESEWLRESIVRNSVMPKTLTPRKRTTSLEEELSPKQGCARFETLNNYYPARYSLIYDRQFVLKSKTNKEETNQSQLRT